MANFHSDEWVHEQIARHHNFALSLYNSDQIVGVFCQGSTNYGLDTPDSDIDTKCIVVPTFKDIALARKPVSTTHVLPNNEHCDGKDVRLYVETFRKQNLNFLEILFTDYFVVNPIYAEQWARLVENRESIARMNQWRAVKSMKGVALEKFHAMEHPYPSKIDIIEKYGYDGKQVSHLIRVYDFLVRYLAGETYRDCLFPSAGLVEHLIEYKNHKIPLELARFEATEVLNHVGFIADKYCSTHLDKEDACCRELLEDVSYEIMKIATLRELCTD